MVFSGCESVARLARLTSRRSCPYGGGRARVAGLARGISRSVSQQHRRPAGPTPGRAAPTGRSGPTRVYRARRTGERKRAPSLCVRKPRLPRPPGPGPDDRNAAPLLTPAVPAPRYRCCLRLCHHRPSSSRRIGHLVAFPRAYVVFAVVTLSGRPLVVNTCSARVHVFYVTTTHCWSIFVIYCKLFLFIPSAFWKRSSVFPTFLIRLPVPRAFVSVSDTFRCWLFFLRFCAISLFTINDTTIIMEINLGGRRQRSGRVPPMKFLEIRNPDVFGT